MADEPQLPSESSPESCSSLVEAYIAQCRTALHPPGHPDRSTSLNNLANAIFARLDYKSDRDSMKDLEEVITYHREALSLRPSGHPDRSPSLSNLADAIFTRYLRLGNMETLEEGITYYREALSLRPPGHPDRSTSLNSLAIAIHTRYEEFGRMEDLEEVITFNHEALSLCPPGHPDHPAFLNNLAGTIFICFEQSGKMEDLEEMIKFSREALALCPPGHPERPVSLGNLANGVTTRYWQLGKMEDLEEGIICDREVLSLHPLGNSQRSIPLNNLAAAVNARYKQSGRIEDLEAVLIYNYEALTLCPPGHRDRSNSLCSLASAILLRYGLYGKLEDLEEVITYDREALSLRPPGHPDHSNSLCSLASAILSRYELYGKPEDLEEVITYEREALSLRPPGHPDRSLSLNGLANAVRTRYRRLGKIEDLEEGITFIHEALSLHPPGHPRRPSSLSGLAHMRRIRHEQFGRIEDLEEAIMYYRETLSLRPPGHPNRSFSLSNLACVVCTRYKRLCRMEDLEEAITYHREALSLCPPGHPDRFCSLGNLANALHIRHKQSGRIEDLEEMNTYHREALSLCPPGHPEHSACLNNLANTIYTFHEQSGRIEDLEEAITYYREALSLSPDFTNFISLNNLANAVRTRYQQSGMVQDLEESFILCQQAANDSTASSRHRLTAALHWIGAARHHHHSSLIRAYSMSLHLLDRCLISYPNVASQQRFLATRASISFTSGAASPVLDDVYIPRSLASDAASAAIDENELQEAVELLEQGRAILWSRMKGYRYPLEQLRHVNSQLADEFETLCVELEHLALSSQSEYRPMDDSDVERPKTLAFLDAQMQRNRFLLEEWEKVMGQIRKIEGFSNFLQSVPFATLQTAAAEGPVILINISNYRSDAIIIHIEKPPTLVRLPKATPKQLTDLGEQLASALTVGQSSKLILPILRHLWNDIVSPVCDSLTQSAIPRKSRIWWCPTSELCALPIHAAGLYQPNQPNSNLHNIYISSYIPTLSALINARSSTPIGESVVPKLLVIGQPAENLPMVQDEIDIIKQFGDFVDVIVGADASRDAVLHGLQQHSWAHFACHGHVGDNSQPFHASFELHGGAHLNLLDLIQARLPNSEFAFLAACHSAAGDPDSPDEIIHLAAALQFCGFRSVVGTLWAVADRAGPIISKAFYNHMFKFNNNLGYKADFRDSAKALNFAVRALWRERAPLEDSIAFVHIGA